MSTIAQQGTRTTLPPGPKRLPIVGNILSFRRDQFGYLQYLQRTYGRMATIYVANFPIVLLFRPEHVRYMLAENPRNFTNREVSQGLIELIGDGLITIDGDAHLHRHALRPAGGEAAPGNYSPALYTPCRARLPPGIPSAHYVAP